MMYQVSQRKSLEIARSVLFWAPPTYHAKQLSYCIHPFYSAPICSCLKLDFLCKLQWDHTCFHHYAGTST